MNFEHNGSKWMVEKSQSVFVSRTGMDDINIYKKSSWGRRHTDGNLYKCCQRIAAESGEIVRNYEAIPSFICVEWLRENGFM